MKTPKIGETFLFTFSDNIEREASVISFNHIRDEFVVVAKNGERLEAMSLVFLKARSRKMTGKSFTSVLKILFSDNGFWFVTGSAVGFLLSSLLFAIYGGIHG